MLAGTIFWLTLTIFHEARGEPDIIQQAVAQVVLNRANQKKRTVSTIVREPAQFSWTLDRKKLKQKPWLTDPENFLKCGLNAVKATVKPDPTGAATHFHESRMTPRWAKKMKLTRKMGPFKFYKERKV